MSATIDHAQWAKAYINEIEKFKDQISNKKITSIFFGGGTPSLMEPSTVQTIIDHICKMASVSNETEITLETNPTSYEAEKFEAFKLAGINRVSIGIQSLNDEDLKFLGREHSSTEAINTIESAANIFDNYSFDLIYSRPKQTIANWQAELAAALKLAQNHLSLYQLTIEKGTKFYSMHQAKEFIMPSDNLSYQLFQLTKEMLEEAGLKRYEVSNFAKNDKESKHNLCYWQYDEYLGIGPGAHSRTNNTAAHQIYHPGNWLKAAFEKNSANQQQEALTDEQIYNEILLMGLRLTKGISFAKLAKKIPHFQQYLTKEKLAALESNKLIATSAERFYVTEFGMPKLNKIIEFLACVN